jgi:site-specific DNA-methyltransferase (adenine-specific)
VELRDFQAFGEPGAIVYLADCVDLMKIIPSGSVDVVFADPPYRLSRGGVTVKSGRLAPVDKGAWDRSMGIERIESLPTSASVSLVSSNVPSG